MKTRLLLLLIALFVIGNASIALTQDDKVVVNVWDMQQSAANILEAQQRAEAEFEAANPNIDIVVTVFPYEEYRDRLLTAAQAGEPPDMASLDQIWMAEFAASGSIVPLDEYLATSTINPDDFFPGAWGSNVYQGQTWGVPLNNDVWQELYYNRDMFEAAGLDPDDPPSTWEELLAACAVLNNPPDQYALALMGTAEPVSLILDSFIFSNGGTILNEDGTEATLSTPEAIEAIAFYKQLETECAPPGTVNRLESEAIGSFTAGQTAMGFFGSWLQDTMKQSDINWDIAMVPVPNEGDTFHGALGGWNMSIFSTAQHPAEAFKYIEFLAQAEWQKAVASLIPAHLVAGQEFIDENRTGGDVLLATVQNGFPRPLSPVYPQVSQAQQDMMAAVFEGMPAAEAAEAATAEINDILLELQ